MSKRGLRQSHALSTVARRERSCKTFGVFGIYSRPDATRRQFSRREQVLGGIAALSCPAIVLLTQRPDWLPGWLALPVAAALAFGGAAWGQYLRNRP